MCDGQEMAAAFLLKRGSELLNQPFSRIEFTRNTNCDDLLNDLNRFPHLDLSTAINSAPVTLR